MTTFSKLLKERSFSQIVVIILLLLLLVMGAVPGYLKGRWDWQGPAKITNMKQLRQISKAGLTLPGWQTLQQKQEQIGGHKWSYQIIQQQSSKNQAILLLFPQKDHKDLPEVEWTEINSWGQWNVAQNRDAEFTVKQPPTKVKAQFFRASTKQKTFAVLQWYAWSRGGNPSPLSWFWADQLAQWRKHRLPWVAVSILIPMEPFGQVETNWRQAQSLGETVQATLMTSAFSSN